MRNPEIYVIKRGCAETIWSTNTPSPVFVRTGLRIEPLFFPYFARGDDGLGRIGRPHKVGAYFGIQEIVLVGILRFIT